MKSRKRSFFILIGMGICFFSCTVSTNPLEQILEGNSSEIKKVAASSSSYEVQILYTSIDRDSMGNPQFTAWPYAVDESQYFYPASTAKLPIAILALQKLNHLRKQGISIDKTTPFHIYNPEDTSFYIRQDSTHENLSLTIAHLIKKIFLVSDNDAYNYLFDFLGRDYINAELQKRGLKHTAIHHKFLFGADNRKTWSYVFFRDSDTLYHQPAIHTTFNRNHADLKGVLKGKGYLSEGHIVKGPMDFSKKNRISIRDLNGILKRLIFPTVFKENERFDLTEEDRSFLRFWMSRNSLESRSPNYNNNPLYWDSYNKFFIHGDVKGAMTENLRLYNKVGAAYGTLTDVAYIKDEISGVEFMLTATILVNENQIFNDDDYEYDAVGIPFLAALGRKVYRYELEKKRDSVIF